MSVSNPIVFIVGATATGKSELAVRVARQFGGAVVNADSLQFYKHLNIGTAKPSEEERCRCPHYLFDICEIGEEFTAGKFRDVANALIDERRKKELLVFVGGSGFYIQALDKGMYDVGSVAVEITHYWEAQLKEKGILVLHNELQKRDPDYTQKIAPQDRYRIVRALSLMESQSKTMTEIRREFASQQEGMALSGPKIKVGLQWERETLKKRVEQRVTRMIASGLVSEVEALLKKTPKDWSPLSSVGYKEVRLFLSEEWSEEQLFEEIVKSTMKLAKSQMTWFRRDESIRWFDGDEGLDPPLLFLEEECKKV